MENQTALFTNTIHKTGMKAFNSALSIKREDILNVYSSEILSKCWDVFSQLISQNYQSGKGTYVQGFGTFTFNNAEISLEGTTNEYTRDTKARKPVFVVSPDFVEHLKPGLYTKNNGLVYYTQKQNNNMSHVKINHAELAFSLGISKDEYVTILNNMIKYIGDTIRKGEFRNKEMPGLGVLQTRGNIIGVKFNDELIEYVKKIPQKLIITKKNVQLYMDASGNQVRDWEKTVGLTNLPNVANTLQSIRPKTTIISKITQSGEQWLKNNYDINVDDIKEEPPKLGNNDVNCTKSQQFVNDLRASMVKKGLRLADLNISPEILEAVYYHKGVIISEIKVFDRRNTGEVKKFECLRALLKANVHYRLTSQMAAEIINLYSPTDSVEYLRMMAALIRDIKLMLGLVDDLKNNRVSCSNEFNKYNENRTDRAFSTMPLSQSMNINTKTFSNKPKELDTKEEFETSSVNLIIDHIASKHWKNDEYFDHLLSYNINRNSNVLSLPDLQKALSLENFKFTPEEVDQLFKFFDTKKDGIIDRQEFISTLTRELKPLTKIKDIIKRNNLDIEDLMFRMGIDISEESFNEKIDFQQFNAKIKLIDYTFPMDFISGLFKELSDGNNYVETRRIFKEFNVFHKDHFKITHTKSESFKRNFINHLKSVAYFSNLKNAFEKLDTQSNGHLSKVDFCTVLQQFVKEYQDEDIMKFIRINSLVDNDNLIKYPEFLNLVYYDAKDDQFTQIIEELKKYLTSSCNSDLFLFFVKMNNMENGHQMQKYITIEKMFEFLRGKVDNLSKKTICKLDLDADGKISFDDMKGIIMRYMATSYFKFENTNKKLEVNLYPKDTLSENKFKTIVKDIKSVMKTRSLTDIGLFNKLDANKDGFISHVEFNTNIDDIISLSSAIKDQFFNYLDVYQLGMVDIETFQKRFTDFTPSGSAVIVKNSNQIEDAMLTQFAVWIKNAQNISETEVFSLIDYDSDGIISLNDFKKFLLEKLSYSKYDLNDFKIERVMQQLSLTKNKNIGLADIEEFMKKCKNNDTESYFDLKDTFQITGSQNVNPLKNNSEWINEAVERLGLYATEVYADIEEFFNENVEKNSKKMKIEDFKKFTAKHLSCFEGFNLTNDEILTIFAFLDSHKKNFLSLEDLKNKLSVFDFFKKMHSDIRTFLKENFQTSIDAFKFFKKSTNENEMAVVDDTSTSTSTYNLSKKEFFDAINLLFPKKFETNTILKYIEKNFKNSEIISFSEFNYAYYGTFLKNETFLNKNLKISKVPSMRPDPSKSCTQFYVNDLNEFSTARSSTTLPYARRFFDVSRHPELETPFDCDPLEKIKRIIHSSRFDYSSLFKIHEIMSENGFVNQFEFRNMIKKLNIGLTNLEIDGIIAKAGKTRDGRINLKDFVKFLSSEDPILVQGKKNILSVLGEMKQLIYKYYSSPKLAFQFNDQIISKHLDFEKFKQIMIHLYEEDSKPAPNFALLKNTYDFIDLRKDGIIDLQEWTRAFSDTESSLDLSALLNPNQLKTLREWENSKSITDIYQFISKNKKLVKDSIKPFLMSQGNSYVVQSSNLINVMKEIFSEINLSNTQWKILVGIADRNKNNLIDFDLFLRLVDLSAKQAVSHPGKKRFIYT